MKFLDTSELIGSAAEEGRTKRATRNRGQNVSCRRRSSVRENGLFKVHIIIILFICTEFSRDREAEDFLKSRYETEYVIVYRREIADLGLAFLYLLFWVSLFCCIPRFCTFLLSNCVIGDLA